MIKQGIRILVLGSVFASGIAAALPIDQSQPDTRTLQSGVNNVSGKLQGFQPSVTNVAGGGFHFGRLAPFDVDMTIAVWNGLPDVGSQIASGTVRLETIGWLDAFWTPVSVIPGETYYLTVTTAGIRDGVLEPAVSSDNPIAGYICCRAGSFNPLTNVLEADTGLTYDFSFRTYYEESSTGVPEPGTLALLGLGLAGLGLGRRRKAP